MTTQIEQLPAIVDIDIISGDYFSLGLTVTGFDLTPYTIEAEINDLYFTITEVDLLSGEFNISLSSDDTKRLKPGLDYKWWLTLILGGNRRTFLAGDVIVREGGL